MFNVSLHIYNLLLLGYFGLSEKGNLKRRPGYSIHILANGQGKGRPKGRSELAYLIDLLVKYTVIGKSRMRDT